MGFTKLFKGINITPSSASKILCFAAFCGLLVLGHCQPYRDSFSNSDDYADTVSNIAAVVAKRSGMSSCQQCKVWRGQCFENKDITSPSKHFECVRMCSKICRKKNTKRDILDSDADNELGYEESFYAQ